MDFNEPCDKVDLAHGNRCCFVEGVSRPFILREEEGWLWPDGRMDRCLIRFTTVGLSVSSLSVYSPVVDLNERCASHPPHPTPNRKWKQNGQSFGRIISLTASLRFYVPWPSKKACSLFLFAQCCFHRHDLPAKNNQVSRTQKMTLTSSCFSRL